MKRLTNKVIVGLFYLEGNLNNMNKTKSSILEGAISLTIATLTIKILGAIYKIPLSHILKDEGMGYFNSAYTIYSFFYLICTAGVPKAIMIICGNASNGIEQKHVLKVGARLFAKLGIITTVLLCVLSYPLSHLIGSPHSRESILIIAPSILFSAVSGVYRGYYSAGTKFLHVAISQIIEGTIKLILGLALAYISNSLYMPIYHISAFTISGATLGSLGSMVYLFVLNKSKLSNDNTKQNCSLSEKMIVKNILNLSIPIAVSAMVMSITNIIDLGMIMNRLQALGYTKAESTSLYGNYTTYAIPIFNSIISLITPITIAFIPQLTKAKHQSKVFVRILNNELEALWAIFIPLTFGTSIYSEDILTLLFDDKGVRLGGILLVYLLFSLVFLLPLVVLNSALEAIGVAKAPLISMCIGGIFKIFTGYILISTETINIYGAPISTLISYAASLVVSLILSNKHKITPSVFKSIGLPLINSFVSIFPLYILYLKLSQQNYAVCNFLIFGVISVIIYIILNIAEGNIKKYRELKNTKTTITALS